MLPFKTYFCPRCGRGLESEECRRSGLRLRCPRCPGTGVRLSGGALIFLGIASVMPLGLMLCVNAPALALVLGTPFVAVGLMRLMEAWALRRARRGVEP